MGRISDAISEYQQIIGAYDRQLWDRSIEASVRKGLKNVARKTAKVNTDLIDVDLVRGSTFSKPKPEHGWFGVSWRAVPRVLFLPLYYRWWKKSTSVWIYCLLSFLYVMQVLTFSLYVLDSDGLHLDAESLSLAHLLTPCILMFVLAFIHTQIMATYVSLKKSRNTRETVEGSKETGEMGADGSEHDSVGSQDTGIDLNPDDVHMKYRPNGVKLAGSRRRSRSSVPVLEVAVNSDNLRNVADADDEADEPSTVGKTSDVERRQSTRSASFDKTVEWLLTQTRSEEYHGADDTSAQNCCQQTATVDMEADCMIRDETTNRVIKSVSQADLSSVEPNLLSSPAHSWTQTNPPAATASVDSMNTAGVRRRVVNRHDLNECLLGDAENDVRRRPLTTQDSRQTFASLGISSGDSEADINTRRHNRSKLWCVRACSHDAHKSSSLCDRRSSAD